MNTMRRIIPHNFFQAMLCLLLIAPLQAQPFGGGGSGPDDGGKPASSPFKKSARRSAKTNNVPSSPEGFDPAEMERKNKSLEEDMRRARRQSIEPLKDINPEKYREELEAISLSEQIEAVLARYRKKEIGDKDAEEKLTPLMKKQLKPEIKALGSRIKRLEKELDFLRKAGDNPDLLVKRRVKERLHPEAAFGGGGAPFGPE